MANIDIEYGKSILANEDLQSVIGGEQPSQDLLQLEMLLKNCSYGHEYARMELEESEDFLKQEELLGKMEAYKIAYFEVRSCLEQFHPHRLSEIETEIQEQKRQIFLNYQA